MQKDQANDDIHRTNVKSAKIRRSIAPGKCKWKVLVIITKGKKASGTLS